MLNLWKKASEKANSTGCTRRSSPSGESPQDSDRLHKKRRITLSPLSNDLPRPTTSADVVFSELTNGNGNSRSMLIAIVLIGSIPVITVVEGPQGAPRICGMCSHVSNMLAARQNLLKMSLGQSVVAQQTTAPSSSHRVILFVVEYVENINSCCSSKKDRLAVCSATTSQ